MIAEYKYETHLHTYPASNCAFASVKESVAFYKEIGYDGVFITNHFLDGNINRKYRSLPYEKQIELYFRDFEEGEAYGKEIGIKVFCGVEVSHGGTDFLVYGLDKKWFLSHPEIMTMKKSAELALFIKSGALVIQAHPYREAAHIDHIRLYPRSVHGVEIINASTREFSNAMAKHYASNYDLIPFAGSDNHGAEKTNYLSGVKFSTPISSVDDFKYRILAREHEIFELANPLLED